MKKFIYHGPASGLSLVIAAKENDSDQEPKRLETLLYDGCRYALPEAHEAVKVLILRGHLELMDEPAAEIKKPAQDTASPKAESAARK